MKKRSRSHAILWPYRVFVLSERYIDIGFLYDVGLQKKRKKILTKPFEEKSIFYDLWYDAQAKYNG